MNNFPGYFQRFTLPPRHSALCIVILSLCCFNCDVAFSQGPVVQWAHCYGGSQIDGGGSIDKTSDGGYIIAGGSYSSDGDLLSTDITKYIWIVKIDHSGTVIWQKKMGGLSLDTANNIYSIHQVADGGYIAAGEVGSNDGDISGNHGGGDAWVVKLDDTGKIIWQRCYGGTLGDGFNSIHQTHDGGYIAAGISNSVDGDVTGNHGDLDFWVVKISAVGTIQWEKSLGGSLSDQGADINLCDDGGYIVSGLTMSDDGDIVRSTLSHAGDPNFWLVKISDTGAIEWQNCLGGSSSDGLTSVLQVKDGGFVTIGWTQSDDGDATGNHGYTDWWIAKMNFAGSMQWEKCLGGSKDEYYSGPVLRQTIDSGYIIAGTTNSIDGDIKNANPDDSTYNAWVIKLSPDGNIKWEKCYGEISDNDAAADILQTLDSGYIFCGGTRSSDGIAAGNHGGADMWVVKLGKDETLEVPMEKMPEINVYPTVTTGILHIDVPQNYGAVEVSAYDLIGQKINLPVSGYPGITAFIGNVAPSVYIIRIATSTEVRDYKVIYLP